MNEAQDVFLAAAKGDASGVDAAAAALDKSEAPDIKADQLKRKLQALLLRAKEPQSTQPQKSQLLTDFEAWEKEYTAWLKTTGKDYES
jgi:hypothetical protein